MYNTSFVPRKRNQPPGIYPGKWYNYFTLQNTLWCHLVVTVLQYNLNLQATAPPDVHYFMPHTLNGKTFLFTRLS